jgi:pimeloyl-ACP methyl ester carboxylesterase
MAGDGPLATVYRLSRHVTQYLFAKPENHYFSRDGLRLHYFDIGQGEPLVLLHGLAMNGGLNWMATGVADRLIDKHRLIIPDLRGHGKSDAPSGRHGYGIALVEDVVGLLDHLGLRKAHIAGYSLGAMIALKAISRYPDRFKSGIIAGAGWRPCSAALREEIEEVARELEESGEDRSLRAQLISPDIDLETRMTCYCLRLIDLWNDASALAAAIRSLPELELPRIDVLRNTVPTHGICGEADMLYDDAVRLNDIKPCHSLTTLPGGNHFTAPLDQRFAEVMRDFLNGQHSALSN